VKAIAIQTFGRSDGLALVELPDPRPTDGQVLIASEAIGVGGVDVIIRSGAFSAYGFTEGHILGGEVAGTVTAVGENVDPSWIGQRVWAFTGLGGGYAEQAVASASTIIALPSALTAADAVTLGTSGRVAHFALRHAHFAAGESVLIRGAAGGIGVMAVQLAIRAGAGAVAVTTSSPERGDRLRGLGATHVLDRFGEPQPDSDAAPPGYDVIIDIVGGANLGAFFGQLNPNGRMVAVGIVDGEPPADFSRAMYAAFQKSLSFATFSTNTVPETDQRAATAELFAAATRGELTAVVYEQLPLEQAALAHSKMDAGDVFGRIVLTTGT
jgi:NADPH2:quinone reductase